MTSSATACGCTDGVLCVTAKRLTAQELVDSLTWALEGTQEALSAYIQSSEAITRHIEEASHAASE